MESPIDGETTTANNTASRTRTIQVNVAPAPTATITPTPPVTATSTETPTHTATPTMVGSCAGAPLPDCRAARQALLKLVGATDPSKDRLLFKWQKGAATAATEFGDPRAATVTSLCLYDGGALKLQAIVPPDGERWRLKGDTADPKGFDFKDANGASGGVTLVKLTAGEEGKASILLKAKRGGLSLPGPVGAETYFGGAVTAQLVNSDGRCWSVGFTGLATKNAGFSSAKPQFKHKCKSSLAAR